MDDGVGNNADVDDDNDGVIDFTELQFIAIMQPTIFLLVNYYRIKTILKLWKIEVVDYPKSAHFREG